MTRRQRISAYCSSLTRGADCQYGTQGQTASTGGTSPAAGKYVVPFVDRGLSGMRSRSSVHRPLRASSCAADCCRGVSRAGPMRLAQSRAKQRVVAAPGVSTKWLPFYDDTATTLRALSARASLKGGEVVSLAATIQPSPTISVNSRRIKAGKGGVVSFACGRCREEDIKVAGFYRTRVFEAVQTPGPIYSPVAVRPRNDGPRQ